MELVEKREPQTIKNFIDALGPHISPEILVIVAVELLKKLEAYHRQGIVHGAIDAHCVQIDEHLGEVTLNHFGDIGPRAADDVYAVATLLQFFINPTAKPQIRKRARKRAKVSYRPEEKQARLHPSLKLILKKAVSPIQSERYGTAWSFSAALLDYLSEMGLEGQYFFLQNFLRDPVSYNRALYTVLSRKAASRIQTWLANGRHKRATAELYFLLEIAPESPQALNLVDAVNKRRNRIAAGFVYASMLIALLWLGESIILPRLNLPVHLPTIGTQKLQPLLIEPVQPERSLSSSPSQDSPAAPVVELNLTRIPLGVHEQSQVRLDLDEDAIAYFDGSPGQVAGHHDMDALQLANGSHTVMIVKPGYNEVIGQIEVKPNTLLIVSGRLLVR